MSDSEVSADAGDMELVGLPRREETQSRIPLEAAASEYLELLRGRTVVDVDEFASRYPAISDELKEFLPLVAAMEDWKEEKAVQVVRHPLPEEFSIERLGKCRIIREIDRGGMGVVFEAEQEPINRRVAVKLLPWRFHEATSWSEQFHREARTAAQLQHPNIVPVFSFGEHEGRLYYVMPLIEGISLDKLINRWRETDTVNIDELIEKVHGPDFADANHSAHRRILKRDNWAQIAKLAIQVVNAIRHAHKKQTLHRDIKPANLLLDRSGTVWVSDFGLALGRDRVLDDDFVPVAGTLRYMAPEQFEGITNERTDIYSFGATLYEMCTLQPAFDAASKSEMIEQIQSAKIRWPRSIKGDVPIRLDNLIKKCMDRRPERRYLTANELYGDLLRIVGELSHGRRGLWSHFRDWF